MSINLRKEKVDEVKSSYGLSDSLRSKVVLVLDISISMADLYNNGTVDEIIERVLPIAMSFDDDGKLDVYTFSDRCTFYGEVGVKDLGGLGKHIKSTTPMGGTKYAPAIRMVALENAKPSFIERMKGKSVDPTYVVFITDGDNNDKEESISAITKASKQPVFFQFVGIGNASFDFLKELDTLEGRYIDNANFFSVNDIKQVSDDELYKRLLKEYPSWIVAAKDKNLIK